MEIFIENEYRNKQFYCDCEIFPCKNVFCIDDKGFVYFPSFIALSNLKDVEPDSDSHELTIVAYLSTYDADNGFWTTCSICNCLYKWQFKRACIYEIKDYKHRRPIIDIVQFILDDFKCHGIPIHPEVYRYIRSKKYLKNVEL